MKKWFDMFGHFAKNRLYVLILSLTAVGAYGFMITHHTVGIDDTPYLYYFEEGLAAIVGRWVLFLLNKVVHIADYAPFLTDLAGVLIFMMAVTVWCVLFYSVLKDRVPLYGYLFFACIFISCPLISEVYVYYLHNGIAIGYLCSGISLYFFLEGLTWGKKSVWFMVGSAVSLVIALGCYESFMMVWLMGVCMILVTGRMCDRKDNVFAAVGAAAAVALGTMVLRSVMISGVTAVFGLEYLKDEAVQRSITEMIGWILEPEAVAEFAMALKRTYVMYGAFACVYYPIRIFVWASVVIALAAIWMSIRKKDAWIVLLTIAGYVAAFTLVVIEGKATYYRSAQFLPVLCGIGALFTVWGGYTVSSGWKDKLKMCSRGVVCVVLAVILWNQCEDMNRWFYIDWQKYEAAKETVHDIAYELERNFDTAKPIVFTGIYEIPASIVDDAFVDYNSAEHYKLLKATTRLDEHLLEKFYREEGIWVAQQPALSVIDWGRDAFETQQELIHFFEMHGYSFRSIDDEATRLEAEELSVSLPEFPTEGSVVDAGDYIVVHF